MRTVAGALLLIAASVCLGASVVADNLPPQSGFKPQVITYLAAAALGLWGSFLLIVGLALDRQAESQPIPARVWTTLLVLLVGVLALAAFLFFLPLSR